jgi:hypothetical protein
MKQKIDFLAVLLVLALSSGCVHRISDIKTVTVMPQKEPVVVTCRGTAEFTDKFFFFQYREILELSSSNDKK